MRTHYHSGVFTRARCTFAQQAETSHPEPPNSKPLPQPLAPAAAAEPDGKDEVQFVLYSGEGHGVKLTMRRTARLPSFHWVSMGGVWNLGCPRWMQWPVDFLREGVGVAEDEGDSRRAFPPAIMAGFSVTGNT